MTRLKVWISAVMLMGLAAIGVPMVAQQGGGAFIPAFNYDIAGAWNFSGTIPTLTGNGSVVGTTATQTLTNKTLTGPVITTPSIGVATGTSLAVTGALTSSGTAGIGYATGAGGTITQATSKSTGVTLSKTVGRITMDGAALAAAAEVSFTVTNTLVAATDVVIVNHGSAGTAGAYLVSVSTVAAGSFVVTVSNASAGSLSEAIVLNFAVLKGASS